MTHTSSRKSKTKKAAQIKVAWIKTPPPFNREGLKTGIRDYVARQKQLKAEIMSGKDPLTFGNSAAILLCTPHKPLTIERIDLPERGKPTRKQVDREIKQVRANTLAIAEILN
jgi:hypothetical protein